MGWIGLFDGPIRPQSLTSFVHHELGAKFDEATTASSIREIGTKRDGVIAGEDLAPLAKVNVEALEEFEYFTTARVGGLRQELGAAVDYWLAFEAGSLTLHFTLPLKSPVKAQMAEFEVYDPNYCVDIRLAEADPVVLVGAPSPCELSVRRQSWAQAANKAAVTCS